MGGRALLVTLLGLMVLSASIFYSITRSSEDLMKNVDTYYLRQSAQDIAQSGANLALLELSKNRAWRTGFPLRDLLDGKVTVRIVDTTYQTKFVVKIVSTGIANHGKPSEQRAASVAFLPVGFIPAAVKAAITTNNPIRTLGGIIVDGRDRTEAGTLIPNFGTLGIWTTRTLSQDGNSQIGGNLSGIDYAPDKPGNPSIIATNQTWPGGYPGTPDSVLGGASQGFPEGTLKAIAQSRIGGSQYVTNPSLLTTPFRGVTYVELPSGGTWQSMGITGSGILIVHNAAKNAGVKNLNSGTFKGLVIADDVIHIHTDIIGGLICLSPSPSEGNCIGNGNGSVLYSSETIRNATGNAGGPSVAKNGSGSGVVAWWE